MFSRNRLRWTILPFLTNCNFSEMCVWPSITLNCFIQSAWKKVAVKKSASVSCEATDETTTQSISSFKVPLKSYVFPLKKLPKMIDTARLVVTIFLGKKIVFVSKKRKCISSPFCNFLPVFQFCVTKVFSRMLFSAWRLRNLATFWQNSFCNFESCRKRTI